MDEEFMKVFRPKVNDLKDLLIQQVRNECQTYAEVSRFLKVRKQQTVWSNDLVLTELIEEVKTFSEEEKGSLPLK